MYDSRRDTELTVADGNRLAVGDGGQGIAGAGARSLNHAAVGEPVAAGVVPHRANQATVNVSRRLDAVAAGRLDAVVLAGAGCSGHGVRRGAGR